MFNLNKIADFGAHHMVFQVVNPDGSVFLESAPIHNLVLTNAYELISTNRVSRLFDYAAVGTGTAEPIATQTGLVAEVARTSSQPSGFADTLVRIANGQYEFTRVRQFNNVANLNLTEWGYSPSASVGNNLAVRELFRDGANNPIPINLTTGQQLRLLYKARFEFNITPQAGNINIAGVGDRAGTLYLLGGNTGLVTYPNNELAAFETISTGAATRAGVFLNSRPATAYLA
jgi:hypothetical protein